MASFNIMGGVGMSYDLLWTNSNPSSSFNAQTVSIDLSAYSKVVVEYQMSTLYADIGSQQQKQIFDVGENRTVYGAFKYNGKWGYSPYRTITVSSTGITFGTGYWNSYSDPESIVPQKIYGIK